ncbi:E-selectin-like [Anoplopoma fimbria]|uniref:E-selectin-like n=1 Tax=Anoplopoma fimbria TaxID=229290 RepID=UPI0023ECCD25|nr:E-selectin-like [Anoplopoma fimbria]
MLLSVIFLFFQLWGNVEVSSSQIACLTLPDVPHAIISEDTKKAEYQGGHLIHFTCEPGYTTSGPPIRYVCTSEGWLAVQQETCNLPSCAPPPADEGITVIGLPNYDDPILSGHVITFTCDGPLKYLNGSSVLICGKDGQWDNPFPSCEDITCEVDVMQPHLHVAGLPTANGKMKVGQILRFHCDDQFTIKGSEEIECLPTGEWNTAFPTCAEKCKVAGVSNSMHLITHVPNNQLRRGQKLRFACNNQRHVLHGKEEVECLANGHWSDPFPTCGAPFGCLKSPALPDGDTVGHVQFTYNHGERVGYVCQYLYTMQGEPYKTCHNGEWIGQMRCLKPCTVNEEAMRLHHIEFRYKDDKKLHVPHTDHLTFKCTEGRYSVSTLNMRQMCVDGEMELPTCQ